MRPANFARLGVGIQMAKMIGICAAAFFLGSATAVFAAPGDDPADAAALKPNRVDIEYQPPKSSAHDSVYKLAKEERVLEIIRDLLSPFRLRRGFLLER